MWRQVLTQIQVVDNFYSLFLLNYISGQPEELEPAATSDKEERLLAVTSVDTNSSEKMGQYFMTVISETRVNTNSGETKIIQYFNVDDYNYFSGQSGSENTEEIATDIGFSGASH